MRPRDLVMCHLRAVGELSDPAGLASAALAEAVGYPGSSAAFAQLLSGMERSGLIEREIRGKRTYRIALVPGPGDATDSASVQERPAAPDPAIPPAHPAAQGTPNRIDYDKLARHLLAEVVRRDHAELARTAASLERKLASVEARQQRLRTENARLRELLAETRAGVTGPPPVTVGGPGASGEDTGAVQLLERLLASLRGEDSSGQSA